MASSADLLYGTKDAEKIPSKKGLADYNIGKTFLDQRMIRPLQTADAPNIHQEPSGKALGIR